MTVAPGSDRSVDELAAAPSWPDLPCPDRADSMSLPRCDLITGIYANLDTASRARSGRTPGQVGPNRTDYADFALVDPRFEHFSCVKELA